MRLPAILRPGVQDLLLLVGLISLLTVQLSGIADDPGVGWHLKTGEIILTQETVPHHDPFLAAPAPRPWIADQWLGDVILASLYHLGGWSLLAGVVTGVFLGTWFGVLYLGGIRLGLPPLLLSFGTILAFKLGQVHFLIRPVIFGFPLFAVTTVLLFSLRRPHTTSRGRRLFLLPPLFLLWTNLHPSFTLGLLLIWLLPAALLLEQGHRVVRDPLFRNALAAALLAALVTLINPYGFALHRSIFALGAEPFFMNFHQEWRSPDLTRFEGQLFLLTGALLLVALFLERAPRSCRLFELLTVATFGALSLDAVRVLPFFGLVVTIPLIRMVSRSRGLARVCRAADKVNRWEAGASQGRLILTVVLPLLIVWPLLTGHLPGVRTIPAPDASKFPWGAVDYLRSVATPAAPVTVIASPDWGGFITWHGGGHVRPVIDDRNTLLGADFYRHFLTAMRPEGAWTRYVQELEGTHILLSPRGALHHVVRTNPSFQLVYEDGIGIVFARIES